jgi:hypothetical protein
MGLELRGDSIARQYFPAPLRFRSVVSLVCEESGKNQVMVSFSGCILNVAAACKRHRAIEPFSVRSLSHSLLGAVQKSCTALSASMTSIEGNAAVSIHPSSPSGCHVDNFSLPQNLRTCSSRAVGGWQTKQRGPIAYVCTASFVFRVSKSTLTHSLKCSG